MDTINAFIKQNVGDKIVRVLDDINLPFDLAVGNPLKIITTVHTNQDTIIVISNAYPKLIFKHLYAFAIRCGQCHEGLTETIFRMQKGESPVLKNQ